MSDWASGSKAIQREGRRHAERREIRRSGRAKAAWEAPMVVATACVACDTVTDDLLFTEQGQMCTTCGLDALTPTTEASNWTSLVSSAMSGTWALWPSLLLWLPLLLGDGDIRLGKGPVVFTLFIAVNFTFAAVNWLAHAAQLKSSRSLGLTGYDRAGSWLGLATSSTGVASTVGVALYFAYLLAVAHG